MVRICIAGEAQCHSFAQACLIADYLSQNLPDFCYERIQKSVVEWEGWLYKINSKNKWHHTDSPIIWKEVFLKGSKPYYISGTSKFLEYCHSYYKLEAVCAYEISEKLIKNNYQLEKKNTSLNENIVKKCCDSLDLGAKEGLCVCISGSGYLLAINIISGLLDLKVGSKSISKILIYDSECPANILELLEKECSYITSNTSKVVKYVRKLGAALANTDFLIVLDHVPFNPEDSIGSWLQENKKLMESLAVVLNTSASLKTRILFANLGPACYNATMLTKLSKIDAENVVVATSGLGLQVLPIIAEIADVPVWNIYCPPVWGFVGINHLVDVRTTMHKYNSFEPYERYTKIKESTLSVGSLTPELRTMEYLLYFDESLWTRIAQIQKKLSIGKLSLNDSQAVVNVVKLWLFGPDSDDIINLGVKCDVCAPRGYHPGAQSGIIHIPDMAKLLLISLTTLLVGVIVKLKKKNRIPIKKKIIKIPLGPKWK